MCFGTKPDSQDPAPRRPQQQQRPQQGQQTQQIKISGPVTPPGQVPAPVKDARGLWVKHTQHEVDRQNLLVALGYVAQYLKDHGENLTLVAVGGAVNTILLQSRATTHDVDFFGQMLANPHLKHLRDAGRFAVERSAVPLSADWLNNATARMPGVVENVDGLVKAAVAQNAVLFKRPGLTVVAAPWNYAFVKKISRMAQGTGRPYDAADAVAYLRQVISSSRSKKPVPFETIQKWGKMYKSLCPVEVLHPVNDLFRRTHGVDGIQGLPGKGQSGAGGNSSGRTRR